MAESAAVAQEKLVADLKQQLDALTFKLSAEAAAKAAKLKAQEEQQELSARFTDKALVHLVTTRLEMSDRFDNKVDQNVNLWDIHKEKYA